MNMVMSFIHSDYGALALNPVGSYLGGVQLKLTREDIVVFDVAGNQIGECVQLCLCILCVSTIECVSVCCSL